MTQRLLCGHLAKIYRLKDRRIIAFGAANLTQGLVRILTLNAGIEALVCAIP